jgi:hypothetical protein
VEQFSGLNMTGLKAQLSSNRVLGLIEATQALQAYGTRVVGPGPGRIEPKRAVEARQRFSHAVLLKQKFAFLIGAQCLRVNRLGLN